MIALLVGGLLLAIYYGWHTIRDKRHPHLLFSGLIETRDINVGSRVGGRVLGVLAREGERVRAGQVLVTLEGKEQRAQRDQAKARLQEARANLEKMKRGFRPEEIEEARANTQSALANWNLLKKGPRIEEINPAKAELQRAEAEYKNAGDNYERYEKLFRKEVISAQMRDNAKTAETAARAARDSAWERLDQLQRGFRAEEVFMAEQKYRQALANQQMLERGYRSEDVKAAQAQVENAQANLQFLEVQVGELDVKTPMDAVVELLNLRPGDLVPPNTPVATLLESSQLWVKIFIPETELHQIHLNQKARVTVEGYPEATFDGLIDQVASKSEFTPRNIQNRSERVHEVFAAKVRLQNRNGILKSGMNAEVAILLQ